MTDRRFLFIPSTDVSRYTDKYRPEEQEPPSLKSVHMQKDVFPSEVWRAYMDGEIRREQIKGARQFFSPSFLSSVSDVHATPSFAVRCHSSPAQKHAKRAKINWEGLDLEEKAGVRCLTICSLIHNRTSRLPLIIALSNTPPPCVLVPSCLLAFLPFSQGELENPERASSDAEEEYAYEDEEDDDYAENYFDNGEDYDDDDGGGGGGDDGGGTYD